MLNINSIELVSEIYGPGKRTVIWVQGCKIRCKGCWNTEMWSLKKNKLFKISNLVKLITSTSETEGITILGGEPLHQSKDLLKLVKKIKKLGYTVMLYTGYERNEIHKPSQRDLCNMSDIIVYGRYIEEKRNIYLMWRGSSNQEIMYNTEKYKKYPTTDNNYVEVIINKSGEITYLGYPESDFVKQA